METRNPDFFNVLCSDKINSDKAAENPCFCRAIWQAGLRVSPQVELKQNSSLFLWLKFC